MLDLDSGPIHLSVEAGIGGTTLALNLAASTLRTEGRVVWLCRTMPNGKRMAQIFSDLEASALERFFAIEFGEELLTKVDSVKPILSQLNENDLIIVDDWCPSHGRVPSSDLQASKIIINYASRTRILIISKAYENPSSKGLPWRSRGGNIEGVRQVWLLMNNRIRSTRVLIEGENKIELELDEFGFHPI